MVENISVNENITPDINSVRERSVSLPPSSDVATSETASQADNVKRQVDESIRKSAQEDKPSVEVEVDPEELEQAIDQLNEKLYMTNREILFKIEKKINKQYISVIDKNSQEVIKEWPPKEIRKFLIGLKELEESMSSHQDVKNLLVNLEV